jgi:hypothetical protein
VLRCFDGEHSTQTRLERKDRKSFKIQKLSVAEDKLRHWNLCALMDPHHIAHSDKRNPQVEVVTCGHFHLTFATQADREKFDLQLELLVMQWTLETRRVASGPRLTDVRSDADRFSKTSTVVPSHRSLAADGQFAIDPLELYPYPMPLQLIDKAKDADSGVNSKNSEASSSRPPSRTSEMLQLPFRSHSQQSSYVSKESQLSFPANAAGLRVNVGSEMADSDPSADSENAATGDSTDDGDDEVMRTPEQSSSDGIYEEDSESEDGNESWYSDDTSAVAPIFRFRPPHTYTTCNNGSESQSSPTGGSANGIGLSGNSSKEVRPTNHAKNLKRRRSNDAEDQDPRRNKSLKNTMKNDELLACPYAKRNPGRYPRCRIKRFPDTHRLK